jgi:hypothetical protein
MAELLVIETSTKVAKQSLQLVPSDLTTELPIPICDRTREPTVKPIAPPYTCITSMNHEI